MSAQGVGAGGGEGLMANTKEFIIKMEWRGTRPNFLIYLDRRSMEDVAYKASDKFTRLPF
jgi:hypothetical protein